MLILPFRRHTKGLVEDGEGSMLRNQSGHDRYRTEPTEKEKSSSYLAPFDRSYRSNPDLLLMTRSKASEETGKV